MEHYVMIFFTSKILLAMCYYMASKFGQVRGHGAMQPYISMQW